MTTDRGYTLKGVSYNEMLATFPWISAVPHFMAPPCQAAAHTGLARGGKPCRSRGVLRYVCLNGTVDYFCGAHLHQQRMSLDRLRRGHPFHAEARRCAAWERKHIVWPGKEPC